MVFPWPVVLASASPRRQDLLSELVSTFEVVPANIDEETFVDDNPWVTAQKTAREKALFVRQNRPDALVISGDTVVAICKQDDVPSRFGQRELSTLNFHRWKQFAKPIDEADALRMLHLLQNRTHLVITGLCVVWPGGMAALTDATTVTFKEMSEHEIKDYIATGEPMDKAGAYGFQGGARSFVDSIEGSPSNVIGLPMEALKEVLQPLRSRS